MPFVFPQWMMQRGKGKYWVQTKNWSSTQQSSSSTARISASYASASMRLGLRVPKKWVMLLASREFVLVFFFAANQFDQFNLTWACFIDNWAGSNKEGTFLHMRWKKQRNSLMGCHKWLSTSAKCRTLCFHLAMADMTFPFLPAWDLYTLCQGCDLFITDTDIYVSHTLICCPLVFYPLINPYLFQLCFQCGLITNNEQKPLRTMHIEVKGSWESAWL